MRILLVDDDEAVLEIVSLMLISEGYTVLAVGTGREALARLEAGEPIDLVLTDLHMPGLSGWDIVGAVRSRWPGVRVGVISGSLRNLPARHEPLDLMLWKPVGLPELRAALRNLEDGTRGDATT